MPLSTPSHCLRGLRISAPPQNSWNLTVPALSASTFRSHGITIVLRCSALGGVNEPILMTVGPAALALVLIDAATAMAPSVPKTEQALAAGKSRKEAIYAANDRFYRGDIAEEFVRGSREEGALFTMADLANWQVRIEEPVMTTYKGIEVYKLQPWQQGPVLLQALNILENFDVQAMGYNSAKYMHAIYQAMNLAYADRDFYYGDPSFPPEEPIEGLLSKEYARDRDHRAGRAHGGCDR